MQVRVFGRVIAEASTLVEAQQTAREAVRDGYPEVEVWDGDEIVDLVEENCWGDVVDYGSWEEVA